jgi:hypothetical protein
MGQDQARDADPDQGRHRTSTRTTARSRRWWPTSWPSGATGRNAVWIWESVLARAPMWWRSCPTWRGAMPRSGQNEKALEYLKRAKELQPKATSVNSLEVILLEPHRQGAAGLQTDQGTDRAGTYDFDLINAAYVLGARAKDWPMAINALELRSERWPEQKADGLFKLGSIYASVAEVKDEDKALAAYKVRAGSDSRSQSRPRCARRFRRLTRRASEHRGPSRTRRCDRRWGLPGVRCRPAAGRAVAPSSKRAPGPNPGADRRMPLH